MTCHFFTDNKTLNSGWNIEEPPMRSATAGVIHLPELISAIFEQGLEPYTIGLPQVARKRRQWLSAICRVSTLWKDVAYSSPKLWALIEMSCLREDWDSSEVPSYQHCVMQLQRAKNVPLDISLNIKVVPPGEIADFWRVWEAVKERAGQWRSIRVGNQMVLTADELGLLIPLALPNVIEADFQCVNAPLQQPISAPRLRSLRLTTSGNHWTYYPFISTQALEVFHFAGPLTATRLILQGSPNLQTIYINNGFGPSWSSDTTAELPNLRCIEARGDITHLSAGLRALRPIASKWKVLRIVCDSTKDNLHEGAAVPPHIPSLTTIEYESQPTFTLAPLRSFLSRIPDATSLTIKLSGATFLNPLECQSFKGSDPDYAWIQERVAEVVWVEALGG